MCKCYVKKEMGVITNRYTHTFDVYLFKRKITINVKRSYVKIIPLPKPKKITNQLQLNLYN